MMAVSVPLAQQLRFQNYPFQLWCHRLHSLPSVEVVAVGADVPVRSAASAFVAAVSSLSEEPFPFASLLPFSFLKLFFLNPCAFVPVEKGRDGPSAPVALQRGDRLQNL